MAFYSSKGVYEAMCNNIAHGRRCVLTRSNQAYAASSSHVGPPRGGRPIGFLMAWLFNGHVPSRVDLASESMTIDQDLRMLCGAQLRGHPDGEGLLIRQRIRVPGEPHEPLDVMEYVRSR